MSRRQVRIVSLFAGVAGLELGLSWALARAGFDPVTVAQVEIDPFCRGVLAMHFPHAMRFEDVTQVGRSNLPAMDVLCGGYPCQGHSDAGKRLGHNDPRSGLWSEFARIIDETRPRFVVVENVAALVARGLDRVVADLRRLAYRVYGRIVAAADVGAPHRRERLFLVASAGRGVGLADARDDGREGGAARDRADGCMGVERGCDAHRRDTDVAHAHGHGLRQHEQRISGGWSREVRDGRDAIADDDRVTRGGGG